MMDLLSAICMAVALVVGLMSLVALLAIGGACYIVVEALDYMCNGGLKGRKRWPESDHHTERPRPE